MVVMKANNYIQPVVEVTAIKATYNILGESNPWNGDPKPDTNGEQIMY